MITDVLHIHVKRLALNMRAFLAIQIFSLTSENLCVGPGRCAGNLHSFLVREATHMIDADIKDPGFEYEEYAS